MVHVGADQEEERGTSEVLLRQGVTDARRQQDEQLHLRRDRIELLRAGEKGAQVRESKQNKNAETKYFLQHKVIAK